MEKYRFWILLILFFVFPLLSGAQTFERNLYFGMRNSADVVRLQNFLRELGYFTYSTATGNYFMATLDAVKKFQKDNGLSPVGGYFGPQSRAAANKLLSTSGTAARASTGEISSGVSSPYKGKIVISYVSGKSDDSRQEYINIENRDSKEKINITGWSLESTKGGRFLVPQGYELPALGDSSLGDIMLKARERATISAGLQNGPTNFRVNMCTGYFDELNDFSPSLSHQCPQPDTRRLISLSDLCLRTVEATPACRLPERGAYIDSNCSQYLSDNLSYSGCVRNYKNREDFYSSEWLIWMQRGAEFLRNTHDTVILRDTQGREVDRYSY